VDILKICASGKLYFDMINYNDLDIEDGGLLIKNSLTATEGQTRHLLHVKANIPTADDGKVLSPNEHVHFKSSF
jgi:hypothetical protein